MTTKDHSTGVKFGDVEKSFTWLAIESNRVLIEDYADDTTERPYIGGDAGIEAVRRQVLEHWEGKTHTSTDQAPSYPNDEVADAISRAIYRTWVNAGKPAIVGRNNR